MYHDNKIALFLSHLYGSYQSELCQGVIEKALEYGYQTEIYCSNDGENLGNYGTGEESILQIPNFETIDGLIFASNTYVDPNVRAQISRTFQQKGCPVVEIAEPDADFPYISVENNVLFRSLAEHLIQVHGAKRICYLGNCSQRYFSDIRQGYVAQVMDSYGLPFPAEDIFLCENTPEDCARALDHFTAHGTQTPDAVICYNDDMAINLWAVAYRAGYVIPRDFAITGCDCYEDGQVLNPPLTTITFPAQNIGAVAVTALMEQLRGQVRPVTSVPAELAFGGSCGCDHPRTVSSFLYQKKLSDQIAQMERHMITSIQMEAEFSHITDIDEGMDSVANYVRRIEHCSDFYICLYSGWDEPSVYLQELMNTPVAPQPSRDSSVLLKLAIQNGVRLPECSFQPNRLLPELIQRGSNAAYIVSPLFFENRLFGYTVMAFDDNILDYRFYHIHWLTNITQLLENIYEHRRLHAVSHQLERIYTKDALTGLYNRHGFTNRKSALLSAVEGAYVVALMFDVDHLKSISDRFGHQEGDFALRTVGQALRSAARQEDLCARFDGDEFYVLAKVDQPEEADAFLRRVYSYLDNFNKLSTKPYTVSACGGFACQPAASLSDEEIQTLFAQADNALRHRKQDRPATFLR